jgi:acetoin utilization protein AcuC
MSEPVTATETTTGTGTSEIVGTTTGEIPTAFIVSPEAARYDLGAHHPFKAIRPQAVQSLLEHAHLLPPERLVTAQPASMEALLAVHARPYVQRVMTASRGEEVPDALDWGLGSSDTPIFAGMHEATLAVAGATLKAAELVAGGHYRRALNLTGGLHHAQRERGGGFCIYNDLSIAIAYLRSQGLRVAYLDIDAHHGDGVQWLHYDDPNVLTISIHETGRYLFPGTGFTYELGRGAGIGYSLNIPLEPYTEAASFIECLERVVPQALAWFKPDVLLLQAGADAHSFDPLADLQLTLGGFERLFVLISQWADVYTGARIIATGGGGYATWTAVPRVWSLLYAKLSAQPLDQVPASWLEQWQPHSQTPLPQDFSDPSPLIPRKAAINDYNARTVTKLLADWRKT